MCLLQNQAYDVDNTSSVWMMNVIEIKRNQVIYQILLSERIATQSMKQKNDHHIYNLTKKKRKEKNRLSFLPMISFR
jgi:hypothetical protein